MCDVKCVVFGAIMDQTCGTDRRHKDLQPARPAYDGLASADLVLLQKKRIVPRSNQNSSAGRLGADKTLLNHRGNEAAVVGEEESARKTARAAGCWAVLRVEQPIVCGKRPRNR